METVFSFETSVTVYQSTHHSTVRHLNLDVLGLDVIPALTRTYCDGDQAGQWTGSSACEVSLKCWPRVGQCLGRQRLHAGTVSSVVRHWIYRVFICTALKSCTSCHVERNVSTTMTPLRKKNRICVFKMGAVTSFPTTYSLQTGEMLDVFGLTQLENLLMRLYRDISCCCCCRCVKR